MANFIALPRAPARDRALPGSISSDNEDFDTAMSD